MSAVRAFAKLTILIADDSAAMRGIVRTVLSGFGCERMFEAEDGRSAMEIVRADPVDLVVCDWKMRPVDGIAFLKALRDPEHSPDPFLPVILLTAYTEADKVAAARDAGATEFLAKPFTAEALYQRIAAIINRPRPYVDHPDFFGPDRRRLRDGYSGPDRRQTAS